MVSAAEELGASAPAEGVSAADTRRNLLRQFWEALARGQRDMLEQVLRRVSPPVVSAFSFDEDEVGEPPVEFGGTLDDGGLAAVFEDELARQPGRCQEATPALTHPGALVRRDNPHRHALSHEVHHREEVG